MAQFNQMELNQIREIVSNHQTVSCKLKDYAQQCSDPQIKQMFEQSSNEAQQAAQNLLNML